MKSVELPSGRNAEVRLITGKEERIFFQNLQHERDDLLEQLIAQCTVSIDDKPVKVEDIMALHRGDVMALLIAIRQISVGDIVSDEFTCPNSDCRNKNAFDINLADIETEPLLGSGEVALPSGTMAVFDYPSGKSSMRYKALTKQKKKALKILDFNAFFMCRDLTLDGEVATVERLDELTLMDRETLFEAMKEVGGPDIRIELQCSECGEPWEGDLVGLKRFLFPKRAA